MWPFSLRIFLSICSVTPFLDQVFRHFFSMDNLRDYGEDNTVSSAGLGQSLAKLPSSSEGLPAPTSSQASLMAASTPATTLVTSGPVPAVSAPTTPTSSVPQDSTVALDDLPPPPPPAEPYEVFMARVSRELASLPVGPARPGAAVPPRPAVATPTTGSRLPMPFPRYEDSSWATQPQAPASGFVCPYLRPATSSVNIAAPPQMPQDAGTLPQGPTPEMVKGWKEELMEDMKNYWKQFIGDAPPQSTVGPAVTHENMGPDALRQLSPSDDQEVSRAQHKTGSKWAGSDSRRHSGSRERSSSDRHRARVRRPPTSPDSSSPTRHRSPPAKRSRWDWREMSNDSSSSEGRQRSTRPRRPWSSRSPGRRRRDSSHSPSPHRRYRSSPAPSRWSSGAGMTKRLAGVPPRCHSGGHPLIIDGPFNHPGAVTRHLRPAPGALIIACPLHPLGRFHLKGAGPIASHHNVTAPGLSAWSLTPIRMIQTFVSCDCGRTMMSNIPPVHIHVIPLTQDNLPQWMPLSYPRKKCRNFLLTLSLRQLSRTVQIPSRIVLLTNNWYSMSARLLLRLQTSRTVNR